MAQHDFQITREDANTGITFRNEVNAALQALATLNSGIGDPAITYPFQIKIDTTTTPRKVFIRRENNSAWVEWAYIHATTGQLMLTGLGSADSPTFAGMTVTGGVTANNIWMKIAEVDLSASTGHTFSGLNGNIQKTYKVIFQGSLAAGGTDRRIFIRPNGVTTNYYSVLDCIQSLDGGAFENVIETDTTGLWVGRSAWHRNADVFFEFMFRAITGNWRVGVGSSSFLHSGNSTSFSRSLSGVWYNSDANITSIWFGPNGGTITGKLMLFALQ